MHKENSGDGLGMGGIERCSDPQFHLQGSVIRVHYWPISNIYTTW